MQNDFGETPLEWAISKRDLEIARMLVEAGADVNLAMNDGRTPLHRALEVGAADIADLLRGAGAEEGGDPRITWQEDNWAFACDFKNNDMVSGKPNPTRRTQKIPTMFQNQSSRIFGLQIDFTSIGIN